MPIEGAPSIFPQTAMGPLLAGSSPGVAQSRGIQKIFGRVQEPPLRYCALTSTSARVDSEITMQSEMLGLDVAAGRRWPLENLVTTVTACAAVTPCKYAPARVRVRACARACVCACVRFISGDSGDSGDNPEKPKLSMVFAVTTRGAHSGDITPNPLRYSTIWRTQRGKRRAAGVRTSANDQRHCAAAHVSRLDTWREAHAQMRPQ